MCAHLQMHEHGHMSGLKLDRIHKKCKWNETRPLYCFLFTPNGNTDSHTLSQCMILDDTKMLPVKTIENTGILVFHPDS